MSSGREFTNYIENLKNQWQPRPREELEQTIQNHLREEKLLSGSILLIVYRMLYPDQPIPSQREGLRSASSSLSPPRPRSPTSPELAGSPKMVQMALSSESVSRESPPPTGFVPDLSSTSNTKTAVYRSSSPRIISHLTTTRLSSSDSSSSASAQILNQLEETIHSRFRDGHLLDDSLPRVVFQVLPNQDIGQSADSTRYNVKYERFENNAPIGPEFGSAEATCESARSMSDISSISTASLRSGSPAERDQSIDVSDECSPFICSHGQSSPKKQSDSPVHSSPTKAGPPSAILLLAEGAEEMETTISADVLRRCDVEVTIAGVGGSQAVTCARKCRLIPDKAMSEASGEYDAIILPGGLEGADNLAASAEVGELLRRQEAANRLICAICAAPIALMAHKIGVGRSVTSHPMKGDELRNAGYKYLDQRVVVDGIFITSRTPGTAFEFALAIVEQLCGSAKAKEEEAQLMLR